jgi:DNA-binding MarR family transcriptional regulator
MPDGNRRPGLLRAVERSNQLVTAYLNQHWSRLQITDAEAHVLAHLVAAEHGRLTVAWVQQAFGMRPSTLTNILDRLEARQLVRREVNPDDRRSFLVVATSRGVRVGREVREVIGALEESVRAGVDSAQLDGFFAVIAAIEEAST